MTGLNLIGFDGKSVKRFWELKPGIKEDGTPLWAGGVDADKGGAIQLWYFGIKADMIPPRANERPFKKGEFAKNLLPPPQQLNLSSC